MARVLIFKDNEVELAKHLMAIKKYCSIPISEPHEYLYNPETKEVECSQSKDEHSKVFAIIRFTPTELAVILPYYVSTLMLPIDLSEGIRPDFDVRFNGILREKQHIDACMILPMIRREGCCYFKAYPSYGKTVMMAYIICQLKLRAIVIVTKTSLSGQTVTKFRELLPDLKIYEIDTNKVIPEDADIIVCYRSRLSGPVKTLARFGTVVFDEVHELNSPQGIPIMLSTRPKYLFAVTATGGDREKITEAFVGPCKVESLSDKRWCIAFPKIRSGLKNADYSSVKGYTAAMNDLTLSASYTNTIARMTMYFCGLGKRVIIITMRCDMCEIIVKLLDGLSVSYLSPDTPKCQNTDVVIGTHKFIGTGFDLSNCVEGFDGKCASVMIFLGSIKNPTLMYQTAGRAFRAVSPMAIYPQISDLAVSSHHINELRARARDIKGCTILNEYGRFLETFND